MTKITINSNGIEAEGHAGYAQVGYDIVCAGISALFNAFVDASVGDITFAASDGYMRVEIINKTPEVMAKYEMLVTGLKLVEDEYPEFVRIVDQAFKSIKGTVQSSIETLTHE